MTEGLERVRQIALAFPAVSERVSHGEPCFFVNGRQPLCYFHHDHNGDGRISIWCPAPPGVPEEVVEADPARFFRPTPSASGTFSGWLGVYLDTAGDDAVNWAEIAGVLEDAYRVVASQKLVVELDRPGSGDQEPTGT